MDLNSRYPWSRQWSGGPAASGKAKPGPGKAKPKGKAPKTVKQATPSPPGKAISKKAAKKAAREARRKIMREDVRAFVGNQRRVIEQRELDAEAQRKARSPFGVFMEDLQRRKLEVQEAQREQMRQMRSKGPGRMGEMGGTVTRAFSIPADLDEDLEAERERLGLGRSAFYEIVFEYFLRVCED